MLHVGPPQPVVEYKMPSVNQFGEVVPQDWTYRIGRIISQIFHPTINGFAAFLLVGATAPSLPTIRYGLMWAAICIATIIIPPAAYFYFRLFKGDFSDDDVSRRSERTGLYIAALLSTVFGSIVLYQFGLPVIFLRLVVAAVGVTFVCMLINFRWKISVHSASIATLSTLATFFLHGVGLIFWLCALAVGWARIRTGNHTPLQVLAGWGVAIAGVLLAFMVGA
jgi:membrane-associated phospholipid phosphatase